MKEVRELAAEFGLEVRGCLGLLAEAARRKLMWVKEAKRDAKRLNEEGYRISEEALKEFYRMLGSKRETVTAMVLWGVNKRRWSVALSRDGLGMCGV